MLDLDGALEKQHAHEASDQNDSPIINIAVIGGASTVPLQHQKLGTTTTSEDRRTSELKLEHQRGSIDSDVKLNAVRQSHHSTYDKLKTQQQQQQLSNDSNSNRSESIQSVESALYSNHQFNNNSSSNTNYKPQQPHSSNHQDNYTSTLSQHQTATAKQLKDNLTTTKTKTDPLSTNPLAELAASFAASNRQRKQSISGGYLHHRRSVGAGGRLSVADLAANASGSGSGAIFRRRRAVEISDHKAVVLLHSKLKGMKLEDIA